uniref:Bm12157 n=1 Tax=Brugia malayi TaxID=6279 RepID=A0A1I9GAY6_BRUMA|nr:Bm12157 [Brugia malayi]
MLEISPKETFDPENLKYQYIFDDMQLQINNELNILNPRSCQNRNNFLLLVEWLSHDNPTLAAKLILQRNDIIARRINGKLLVAPCKSKEMNSTTVEFEAGIISKFENERIDAELEILARKQESVQLVSETQTTESLWQEINQQGEEFEDQLEDILGKATKAIQKELSDLIWHWRLIMFAIIVFALLVVLIILGNFNCFFFLDSYVLRFICLRKSRNREIPTTIPVHLIQTCTTHNQGLESVEDHNVLSYKPQIYPLEYFSLFPRECREQARNSTRNNLCTEQSNLAKGQI